MMNGDDIDVKCPCCGQAVGVPTLNVVIEACGISDFQARILSAIWNGKGRPVPTQRIFDAMYADDPDGGPSEGRMYKSLKAGMNKLRHRLEGSGVGIENVGYRRGYRINIKGVNNG